MKNIDVLRLRIRHMSGRQVEIKKESGQMEGVMGLFFILFLGVLLAGQLQIMQYRASSLYMEDALATSNLASAVIDLEEYGISNTVQIKEPEQSFEIYLEALKNNLELNEDMVSSKNGLIGGTVIVENYTVYNVTGHQVFSFQVTDSGVVSRSGVLGEMRAPNGVLVEATGVYSEISYPIRDFMGENIWARKGKLVDVVASVKSAEAGG